MGGLTPALGKVLGEPLFYRALLTSFVIAALSSVLAVAAAYGLALARAAHPLRALDAAALIGLVVPPVVIAAGWFLIAHRLGVAHRVTPLLVVLLNAMMAMPYAASVLMPAVRATVERYDRLSSSLGLAGWARFWRIDLPLLARPMALALGLSALVSLGDLGIIAIFGGEGLTTLPLLLYQRLGSYRTEDAAALALLLMGLSLTLTWLLPRRSVEERTMMSKSIALKDVRFRYEDMDMGFDLAVEAGSLPRRHRPERRGQVDIAQSHCRI